MKLHELKSRRKKLQRLLHLTKRKKLACKLYLKGNPEQASREMQYYLFELEQKHKNPKDFIAGFLGVLAASLIMIIFYGLNALPVHYGASAVFVVFLLGLFFVPYVANKYHMAKTRKFIENQVLPDLEGRISWYLERIKILERQLKAEQSKYEAWRRFNEDRDKQRTGRNRHGMSRSEALRILNLEDPVGFEEVKTAYRKLIVEWHPDRAANREGVDLEEAQRKTVELNRAYAFLKEMMQPASSQ